jgi:tRNA A37 threonylcarbamoyltransferase TsaD
MGDGLPDFSFSGLKTAVTNMFEKTGLTPVENGGEPSQGIKDLAAKFSTHCRTVVSQDDGEDRKRVLPEYPDCCWRSGVQWEVA